MLPTILLVTVLVVVPDRATLAVRVWLLVLLALVALACVGLLRRTYAQREAPFAQRPSMHAPPARIPSLERIEREVTLAAASAYDVHFRLRPTLREVTRELLAARRGVGLDRSPARAHELLGDETWALVRADREPPTDPRGPGLDRAALENVLASLERL